MLSPQLLALLSAILFSTGGAAIKSTTLNSWQVAGARSMVAALALAIALPHSRRLAHRAVWIAAIAYALTLIFFVNATKLTTSANAIFLQGSAPVFLLLLGPWLLKEANKPRDYAILLAIGMGMTLIFISPTTTTTLAPNPDLGNAFGAASGLTWAFTLLGFRWVQSKGIDPIAAALAGNILVALTCFPTQFSATDLAPILYLGLIQIALAYWCLTRAVAHLSALEAALLGMLEPALNPFWTWLLHNERPANLALIGGTVILLATTIQALLPKQKPATKPAMC